MTSGNCTYNDHNLRPDPPHQPLYLSRLLANLTAAGNVKTVLDAGCGDGNFAESLSKHGFRMFGIDMSESGIRIAKARNCGEFAVSSMYDSLTKPFPEVSTFDAIIAIDTVEHLYSPKNFAQRCSEALRPGGVLVVTVPYWGYLKNILLAITGRMDRQFTALWEGGHIKHWSKETLTKLMTRQGLELVRFEGCGRPIPYLWNSMMLTFRKPEESRG